MHAPSGGYAVVHMRWEASVSLSLERGANDQGREMAGSPAHPDLISIRCRGAGAACSVGPIGCHLVPEFGRSLLKPLGATAGKIETFVEVPFKLSDGRSIRPDGIIVITRGGKSWGAIVETKVASASLEADQIDAYLDLARELQFNAVLSISNHYVTSSSAYPIEVDKRKTKKIALHHWSWIDVLTEAVVQKQHRGISDP